ncbi:hypothetical protein, conserved [Trypanosoma cruzi]|uniref:Uncharacterized protein n=1 Tax=Trypanosoma cruzi (strain CL Brener) TaxID=353153 RepID=Q4DAP0_TRYCC|nr:hypothetical protein, conserved [Trypanosoma cruzi]EAN89598.1 hypothetical protein, conserved [Trypanosoma cruzi]|eukprot:XP_811449.1 hypothetical protein [Trypanosoma cruzi strain CL Brener]
MNLPPSDPPSENTERGSDTAMAIVLGSIFVVAVLFMILCIVWSVFWRRRRMAAIESRRRRHYPEVEAVPQNVTGGDVEGALLVGEDNRSILENASVVLTRVRSLSPSLSLLSATKEGDSGELTVDAVALRGESDEVRVPQSGEGGANLLPQPSQPRTFRLPKEIYDTSTNSVRKLYVRRPSAAVYGSSVYISKNNSVEPTSNYCGRPQELAVSEEEGKKE